MTRKTFRAIRDGQDWIVADASVAAASFAMIPVVADFCVFYSSRGDAVAAAERVSLMDGVTTRMIETPDRFEDVADTKYGPAWD